MAVTVFNLNLKSTSMKKYFLSFFFLFIQLIVYFEADKEKMKSRDFIVLYSLYSLFCLIHKPVFLHIYSSPSLNKHVQNISLSICTYINVHILFYLCSFSKSFKIFVEIVILGGFYMR